MAFIFTDDNFQKEALEFKGTVLIDMWAEWCGPCLVQGPIVDKLAETTANNQSVKIGKLNVDDNPKTAEKYQVLSIPTLLIFKNGELQESLVGLRSEQDIVAKMNYYTQAG